VPQLVAAGHEVHGMTRNASKQAMLLELGATPVIADALDPDQVTQLTAIGISRRVIHTQSPSRSSAKRNATTIIDGLRRSVTRVAGRARVSSSRETSPIARNLLHE
jgi:uncharacterized protein YbjT (DUF2867 family)